MNEADVADILPVILTDPEIVWFPTNTFEPVVAILFGTFEAKEDVSE